MKIYNFLYLNNGSRNLTRYRNQILWATVLLFTSFGCCAHGKWEESTARYTDATYKFHWNLPQELDWQKVQPIEPHTVFAAISPLNLYAFVNITTLTNPNLNNLWDNFDIQKQVEIISIQKVEERTGAAVSLLGFTKCMFRGRKAIKTISKIESVDDVQDEITYGITYKFIENGKYWQVSLKCSDVVWDAFEDKDTLLEVFAGFGFNAK